MTTINKTEYDPSIGNGNYAIGKYAGTHKQWECESDWHYHDDWNWLMPIVKQLLFNERWDGPGFEFEDKLNELEEALKTCEILDILNATVDVITWIHDREKKNIEELLIMGWNDYISEVDEPPNHAQSINDVDMKLEGFYNRFQDEIDLYETL